MRRLVLATSICRREFGADTVPKADLPILLRSAVIDLTTIIKGERLPAGTRLLKAHATSPGGARRIVHLLAVADRTLFFLFCRDKKDPAGANTSILNPAFKRQLHRHLDLLAKDLQAGDFTVLEISD